MKKKRIVVFASGGGSNFRAIHQACLNREIPADIVALISDSRKALALEYAREHKIRDVVLPPRDFDDEAQYTRALMDILEETAPDLIILAGYLKKIPHKVLEQYPRKIINIHPALLPEYGGKGWYGMRVHRAVIENRESESGCTVHYVTRDYDKGPVIAQVKVPVHSDDTPETLAKRILKQEHKLYPKVIRFLLTQK
ncbi:MAG: phosphoribosylglycinamide formyltransferase [Cyclonatronaceae bacterium]